MQPYKPTWTSLSSHPFPTWLRDAKFGIYTHWGPYSVAGYGGARQFLNGSWYARHMYLTDAREYDYHCKHFGTPSKTLGYKDLIPQFTAEKFDAAEWADLFARSGAKFAGPVAAHHDNFAMWNSQVNPWNAAKMGPKRDVTGELAKAIRAEGMSFIATFHNAYNWWFFPKSEAFDTLDPACEMLYSRCKQERDLPDQQYHEDWRDMVFEVIEKYEPDLLWFDFGLGLLRDRYRREFLAHYYNKAAAWGREVAVTYKKTGAGYNLPPLTAMLDFEVGKMNELTPHPWISDTSIDTGFGGSWSHVRNVGFKSAERLVHNLVDRVSKNGYLLLNIGPRADGTIPEGAQESLEKMGDWLRINGEAIYGTVPWLHAEEGPTKGAASGDFNEGAELRFNSQDIRYTSKDNDVYATCLGRPGERVTMKVFLDRTDDSNEVLTGTGPIRNAQYLYPEDIARITMLGHDGSLPWEFDDDGLQVDLPRKVPSEIAVSLKIETLG
ncbi:MAG: hypothetical protein HN919_09145 [Verrucomicrobia bacterium]|jgi:alpha-L-fucosidase|nr:hypothetical protein [Verrucomicrobiota bacterium]MBT7066454.1 hypothetical protein [Verrucomicrobiota bacterium]MBT7699980.1 hypothetical protein [Verrucomicrobiota bacterium]